jgi:hypothetical protein
MDFDQLLREADPARDITVPAPDSPSARAIKERVVAYRPDGRRRRGRSLAGRPGWRLAAAGLAAAVAAAGTATAMITASNSAPPARLTAAELAYRVAAVAARGAEVRPGQWVLRELYAPHKTPFQANGVTLQWATADNKVNAFYVGSRLVVGPWSTWQPLGCVSATRPPRPQPCAPGHQHYLKFPVVTPAVSYSQLASLPAGPRQLIAVLAALKPSATGPEPARLVKSHLVRLPVPSRAFRVFSVIASVLDYYVVPPRLAAELYRALGDLPGVQVQHDAMDASGRHGIAFYVPLRPHAQSGADIIVNPRTYQFMGSGIGQNGTAVLRQAIVSGPGIRPVRH